MDKEKDILKLDTERFILEKKVLIKMAVIELQRKRIMHLGALLKDALGYGFEKNQEKTRLLKHIKGLELKIREVMEDGKNRVHGDKQE